MAHTLKYWQDMQKFLAGAHVNQLAWHQTLLSARLGVDQKRAYAMASVYALTDEVQKQMWRPHGVIRAGAGVPLPHTPTYEGRDLSGWVAELMRLDRTLTWIDKHLCSNFKVLCTIEEMQGVANRGVENAE